jgi:hypothetical protein
MHASYKCAQKSRVPKGYSEQNFKFNFSAKPDPYIHNVDDKFVGGDGWYQLIKETDQRTMAMTKIKTDGAKDRGSSFTTS